MKDGKIIRDIPTSVVGNRSGAKEEPKQERRAQALRSCHARRREKSGGDFRKDRISYFNSILRNSLYSKKKPNPSPIGMKFGFLGFGGASGI